MFCASCGKRLDGGEKFCAGCGAQIDGSGGVSPNQIGAQPAFSPQNQNTSGVKKTPVFVLNLFGLNWISRFITGHIGTGILVLLLDIVSWATTAFIIGYVGLGIGGIIWLVDLITVCTNKWITRDGKYVTQW